MGYQSNLNEAGDFGDEQRITVVPTFDDFTVFVFHEPTFPNFKWGIGHRA